MAVGFPSRKQLQFLYYVVLTAANDLLGISALFFQQTGLSLKNIGCINSDVLVLRLELNPKWFDNRDRVVIKCLIKFLGNSAFISVAK